MAPVYVACRLSALSWLLFMTVLATLFIHDATSALIYDRHTLLNIRSSYEKFFKEGRGELQLPTIKPQLIIPTWLKHEPWPPVEKKRRRRGKRGGKLVKLKAYLVSLPRSPCPVDALLWGWCGGRVLYRRSENVMPRWVQPVEPAGPVVTCLQRTLYLHWNGVHLQNLRPVPVARSSLTTPWWMIRDQR